MNFSQLKLSFPSSSSKRKRDSDSFDEPRGYISHNLISHLRGALERSCFVANSFYYRFLRFSNFATNSSPLTLSFPSSSSKRKRDSDSFDEPGGYKRPKYDVFMNYSKDIGESFISHLRGSLKRNDFTISDLHAGQSVCSELMKPIEDSDIYLVVFSCKYASSVNCLDGLVDIMDCFRKFGRRKVFPVFFKVEPSDVRNQEGVFHEAFEAHETNFSAERVESWRQAMRDVGQHSGHELQHGHDEGKFIKQIVKDLMKMKNPLELFDATHPVGIESRVEGLISKLRLGDNDCTIVAVLGMGGSGKTTIVKAVYDRIAADFEARCFIENIYGYKDSRGIREVDLQQRVISSLTSNNKFHNNAPADIRRFITTQKAFLVLDGVDDFEQLEALGFKFNPSLTSFHCGSKIIVTTRDKQSLSTLPYTPYEISLLNNTESFELFIGHAFGKDEQVDMNFVREIVWRAEGLPLVLEIWGRHFKCHKRTQWPSILEKLKRIPHGDVQKKLQLSYDSLTDRAKKLFLDIAFFFYKMKMDLVVKVLLDEDLAFYPDIEIQYLVDKGLVTNNSNYVSMHRSIWEMGLEVVRRENEDEPGKRSRLMGLKEVGRVLRDNLGTDSVESISLADDDDGTSEEPLQMEVFKKMSNLRLIRLGSDPNPIRNLKYLEWSSSSNGEMSSITLKKLKYLELQNFPCKCIDNINMDNVVVIILMHSKLEILWEGFKSLPNLRILDVSGSESLTKTGNFTGLEKLETLDLSECSKLEELDSSIGCLEKLVHLYLSYCTQLKTFPWKMIGKLTSLVELKLRECFNILNTLSEVPDSLFQLHELRRLPLSECTNLKSIPNLPPYIEVVDANDCISLVNLPSNMPELLCLTDLSMKNCNLSQVSSEIGNMVSLKYLDFSEIPFSNLPDSFSNLSELVELNINDCSRLESIPNLPPNIQEVAANDCISLVNLPSNMFELQFLDKLSMRNCNLSQVSSEIGNLVSLEYLDFSGNPFSNLPDSFSNLSELVELSINDCSRLESIPNLPPNINRIELNDCISLVNLPSNMFELQFLKELSMRNCNLSQVSSEIGNLVSLNYLDLSNNPFSTIPDSFINLSTLVELKMNGCSELQLLPFLPSNLIRLDAHKCWSLDVTPYDSMQKAYIFNSKMFEESFFTNDEVISMSFSGEEVPEWCSYTHKHAFSFKAPRHFDKQICGVIVYCAIKEVIIYTYFSLRLLNITRQTSHAFGGSFPASPSMVVMIGPLNDKTLVVEAGDFLQLEFDTDRIEVSSFGLSFIYEGDVVNDSTLLIPEERTEPPFTPINVPSSENEITAADKECIYSNFFRII